MPQPPSRVRLTAGRVESFACPAGTGRPSENMMTDVTKTGFGLKGDALDSLSVASTRLCALLLNGQGEAIREMNDELQNAYLEACFDLAAEIKSRVDKMMPRPA